MNILGQLDIIKKLLNLESCNIQISYEYDENMNISKEIYTGDVNMTTEYKYNENHDITEEKITSFDNKVLYKKYFYNENGDLINTVITKEGE